MLTLHWQNLENNTKKLPWRKSFFYLNGSRVLKKIQRKKELKKGRVRKASLSFYIKFIKNTHYTLANEPFIDKLIDYICELIDLKFKGHILDMNWVLINEPDIYCENGKYGSLCTDRSFSKPKSFPPHYYMYRRVECEPPHFLVRPTFC